MRRRVLVALLTVGGGWRGDGDATFPDATPPGAYVAAEATWKAALPAWGNASPVPFGGMICTTAEPTFVVCVDAATGAPRWQARNDRLLTLPEAERGPMKARLDRADAVATSLSEGLSELSRLRREARRDQGDPAIAARITATSTEVDRLAAERDALRAWTTPADLDLIGYASSTPTSDGTRLYAMTGNGVVSAYGKDGTRAWTRWLGEPVRPMRGYDYGSVTSPQLADGVLVVGHRHLAGLDPTTGAVRWKDPATWDHYGTPATLDIDGLVVLATPDGRILRAADGVELASGLADLYYVGPVAEGDRVWWIGGKGHRGDPATNRAAGWRLARDGQGVEATRLFEGALPAAERVYASPLVAGDRLLYLTIDNVLTVLDANSGAVRGQTDLGPALETTGFRGLIGYANPTLVGGTLHLGFEKGVFATLTVSDTPTVVQVSVLPEPSRATPWFRGPTTWVRTLTTLWRFH